MKNRLVQRVEEASAKLARDFTQKMMAEEKEKEAKEGKEAKEAPEFVRQLADFQVGDTVDVHVRILEGAKGRTQVFSGVVIGRRGEGMGEMFTVRRIVQGEGVERTFPIHSPRIVKLEVKRTGVVRRAKLYYLRDRVGKATRLRERKVDTRKGKGDKAAE